jgi:hypothetical protein
MPNMKVTFFQINAVLFSHLQFHPTQFLTKSRRLENTGYDTQSNFSSGTELSIEVSGVVRKGRVSTPEMFWHRAPTGEFRKIRKQTGERTPHQFSGSGD